MKLKKGFTLIELLVVIAIIGILATVVIINVAGAKGKANNTKVLADLNSAGKVASQCYIENGTITTDGVTGLGNIAANLSPGGVICKDANQVAGTWPSWGANFRATNGRDWELGTGAWTGSDFTILANADGGTLDNGDFRVSCTSAGCVKQEYSSGDWKTATSW